MVFLRRDGRHEPNPTLDAWRIGLFFLAAGVWLAGVLMDDMRVTGAAIVILLVAILLRLFSRRTRPDEDEPASME